jgi:hypothetical protein
LNVPADALSPPLSLKGLLDGALRRLRRHLRELYVPYALPLAIGGGAAVIAQMRLTYPPNGSPASPFTPMIVSLAVGFGSALLYGLVYAAMIVAATDVVAGRPTSASRSWRCVLRPRFLGTQVLAGMALIGGLLLCVLPGIYVGLVLSLLVPVMVQESRFGTQALGRSVRLMGHNPRREFSADPRVRSFLLNFAGLLIGWAVSVVIGIPSAIVMFILMFRAAAQGHQADPEALMRQVMWIQVPSNMLGMLVQALVFLYMAFGVALLYADVLKRKEGADLLAAAERLLQGARPGAR